MDRERVESEPTTEIRCRARVASEGRRLEVDGQILLDCGGTRPATLPLWISQPGADPSAWSFRGGPDLQRAVVLPAGRSGPRPLGLPAEGVVWSVPVAGISPTGQARIVFRAELPWKPGGAVPLVSAPRQLSPRTTLLIETTTRTRSWVEALGVRRIDTAAGERLGNSWRGEASPASPAVAADAPRDILAHAFYLTEPGGSLNLHTEELVQVPQAGLVRDACLTSLLHPRGPWLHRLRMMLHAEKSGELRLALPASASLVRIQLDGGDTPPARDQEKYVVPIPAASAGQRFRTVNVDYESSGKELRSGASLDPVLPELDRPCLSFCWELIMPPRWAARELGPGLHSTEPPPVPAWPFSAWGCRTGGGRPGRPGSRQRPRRRSAGSTSSSPGWRPRN